MSGRNVAFLTVDNTRNSGGIEHPRFTKQVAPNVVDLEFHHGTGGAAGGATTPPSVTFKLQAK